MDPATIIPGVNLMVRAANSTSDASSSASSTPPTYKAVGITLAVASGLFIGTSFVLKKKGLLKSNAKYNEEAGEGYGYLKNWFWWTGMTLMIVGELCNFAAYAFVDAILVAPMGALSVVITAILSAIFLKERLSFVGKIGCFNCIIGSVVIAANSPQQQSASTIQEMKSYVIAPGFLSYAGVIIVGCIILAKWAGPRYGKKSMLVYLTICSLIGGLSVVATQGLGAAIVAQARGTPQFNQWFIYVLLAFVVCTLLTEIIYLNKALNIFNAALVTPTYYVYFTSATIVTSAILFRGFKGTAIQILTIVLGFLVICSGVILLQLSKSAKDVPDAAVFKGDLDQVRTIAEQEERESEPKADAIRGSAALLRSMSKTRLRREASQARQIQEELLEPIGENEQVEWDGLRRRKTILRPGDSPALQPKSVHPPLGLTHFPGTDEEVNDDELSIFPGLHKRARTMLDRARSTSSDKNSAPSRLPKSYTVPLSEMATSKIGYPGGKRSDPLSSMRIVSGESQKSTESASGDLSQQQPQLYSLPSDVKRTVSIGLSGMHEQDTSYKSTTSSSAAAPAAPAAGVHFSPSVDVRPTHLAPTPPPYSAGRRSLSFQNVFRRSASSNHDGSSESPRPPSSGGSIFGGLRSRHSQMPTEEERLGLVQGDPKGKSITSASPLLSSDSTIVPPRHSSRQTAAPPMITRTVPEGDEDEENDSGDSSDEHYRTRGDYTDEEDDDDRIINTYAARTRTKESWLGGLQGPPPPSKSPPPPIEKSPPLPAPPYGASSSNSSSGVTGAKGPGTGDKGGSNESGASGGGASVSSGAFV